MQHLTLVSMGFIAEFRLTSPTMRQTTRALPSTSLEMEDLQLLEGQLPRYYFWASGGDIDELEQQLERDGTIEHFAFLTEVRDRRLCRVIFTEESANGSRIPTLPNSTWSTSASSSRTGGATSAPRSSRVTRYATTGTAASGGSSRSRSSGSTRGLRRRHAPVRSHRATA